MTTEADTCRKYITPALQRAGWDNAPHSLAEQRTFTDGRIVPTGDRIHCPQQKRADYLKRNDRLVKVQDPAHRLPREEIVPRVWYRVRQEG